MVDLAVVVILLLLGLVAGSWFEKNHYKSIKERERKFRNQPAVTARRWNESKRVVETRLVTGSVVVSVDYFKRFLSGFRNVFGGEMKSYSSLIDRGRREAILRMKEKCPNAHEYVNLRMETSTVSGGRSENSVGCIEVIAFATAVTYEA